MKQTESLKEKLHKPMSGKARLAVLALGGCLMFGAGAAGAVAYLTSADSAVNTFTVGNIKVDTTEPAWPGNGSSEVTDILPMSRIPKDPRVNNTGKNDAVVFMTVDIPMSDVIYADQTGVRHDEQNVELFEFQSGNSGYNSIGAGWSLLETTYLDGNLDPTDPNAMTCIRIRQRRHTAGGFTAIKTGSVPVPAQTRSSPMSGRLILLKAIWKAPLWILSYPPMRCRQTT